MKKFNKFIYKYSNRNVIILLIAVILVVFIGYASFGNESTDLHKIHSIQKIESIDGNKDHVKTEIYYYVVTDRGVYRVETSGFNAAPECSALKVDSTYILTTRGISIPFLGIYSNIVKCK